MLMNLATKAAVVKGEGPNKLTATLITIMKKASLANLIFVHITNHRT